MVALATAFIIVSTTLSCTKLDTTSQGNDVLVIDNINTFADTLSNFPFPAINVTQGFFTNDSTIVAKNENYAIGKISNDPQFGKTDAAIYVQFKPTFYPYYFGNAGDTVKKGTIGNASPNAGFDSAFICLSYKGAWGDTLFAGSQPQTFEVHKFSSNEFRFNTDTIRKLSYQPFFTSSTLWGTATITPQSIARFHKQNKGIIKDSVNNQIRIKLDSTLVAALYYGQDSTAFTVPGGNNGFFNDSLFRERFNGFAITSTGGGNTIYYVNIAEAKSRLEFHFHKTKAGVRDTVVQSFQMYPNQIGNIRTSSSNNYIKRDYTGAALNTPSAEHVYIQAAPGTFANIKIPGLTGYSNRIVHRAFLIVEQDPSATSLDNIYTPPPYLYLDLKSNVASTPQQFKPIYFDLSNQPYNPDALTSPNYFPTSNIDVANFGGFALKRFDAIGLPFYRYEFNITRYVQHIVSNGFFNYDLRLYCPYNIFYPQYTGTKFLIPFRNPLAVGRVRVGTGTNSNNHKMKLVVIYSKI